ncbi:MAG: tRNA (N6-isopentenyl adenosine(37)-C2)-methylthiotransferase MiaB [Ruminococcus sp.]|jgi:tRNA-2-methylthio-N6-dimethylallyladenosine synthase|nr:tRNA (N6-isopentenyl adenosine(37)-C2)-methylthiotransferase MiaB [Ruminococcus sp.]
MIEILEKLSETFSKRQSPPLVFLHSFGCRQNVSDGESTVGLLVKAGCGVTDTPDNADIIIYNTCAVRENAEKHVYGVLGELTHIKERNPDVIIGVCGCMVKQKHVAEFIKKTYRHVDFLFGNNAETLPDILLEILDKRTFMMNINEPDIIPEREFIQRKSKIFADVPIMYGCNNFCTYCIVPYVRGRERSRSPHDIIEEIKALSKDNIKEIMLLGQNANSYSSDNVDFAELLLKINDIDGDFRVRFMSPHPKDMGSDVLQAIAQSEKICKHIHLPLQSGSNRILEAMNRRYTKEKFLETADKARSLMPGLSISTDIIVGFPNETAEDFEDTLDVVKTIGFTNIFTFIYSKRSGTKAAEIIDLTPKDEKTARMTRLLSLQNEISTKIMADFVGKTVKVLIEEQKDGILFGKSEHSIGVKTPGDPGEVGTFKDVKITGAKRSELYGEIVNS